jgi:arginase
MKPLIIPTPFAKSDYGTQAEFIYKRILGISSANETMVGKNDSNILQNKCEILEPISFESFDGDEKNETPYIQSAQSMQENLAMAVEKNLDFSRKHLVIGGDHTISIGTGLGLSRRLDMKKIGLLYIDQHGDCNTPKTSSS